MEFYTAIKKSEIMEISGKWIEMGKIAASKGIQTNKDKYYMCSFICGYYHLNFRFVSLTCHGCRSQKL